MSFSDLLKMIQKEVFRDGSLEFGLEISAICLPCKVSEMLAVSLILKTKLNKTSDCQASSQFSGMETVRKKEGFPNIYTHPFDMHLIYSTTY